MKMEIKVMSHASAMAVENRPKFNRPELNGVYSFVGSDYVMQKSGVVAKVAKTKVVDPKVEMSKYRVSDFALENLIAAGAADSLKDYSVSLNPLEACEMADKVLDSMDALEANNNVKNDED